MKSICTQEIYEQIHIFTAVVKHLRYVPICRWFFIYLLPNVHHVRVFLLNVIVKITAEFEADERYKHKTGVILSSLSLASILHSWFFRQKLIHPNALLCTVPMPTWFKNIFAYAATQDRTNSISREYNSTEMQRLWSERILLTVNISQAMQMSREYMRDSRIILWVTLILHLHWVDYY